MLTTDRAEKMKAIHLWFPNMFEFKGGIQAYLLDFLSVLSKNNPSSHLSVFNKLDNPGSQKNVSKTVDFHFSGHIPRQLRTVYFSFQLFIFALLKKPDLIICGHINFSPVAYWVSRLTNTPYWILVYGIDAWNVNEPMRKKALRKADKIVSIGTFTRDRIIEEQNIGIEKFSLLPVTFDSERFKPCPKPKYLLHRYGLDSSQPIILTVARLLKSDGYKGYDKVISTLPKISEALPNIHYLIVGKGNDQTRIEQLIEDLNVQKYVTLTGFIPDSELVDHYNVCDVFAMPSKGEGFGIVYLEALSCGKPVLGGNQDGAVDALCFGKLGMLVDPDDTEAIADGLVELLRSSRNGAALHNPEDLRQRAIDAFGFDQFTKKLTELMSLADEGN